MAQFCFGAFRSSSPAVGAAAHRAYYYWRGATTISWLPRSFRIDFSRLNHNNSSKFEVSDQRPVTVSGGKAACAARRPELEALGG